MRRILPLFLLISACSPAAHDSNANVAAAEAYREAASEFPEGSPSRERLLAKAERLENGTGRTAVAAPAAPVVSDPLVTIEETPTATLEAEPAAPIADEAAPQTDKTGGITVTYLIGFDWNRDTLDAEAEEVVGDALTDAHNVERYDIVVDGHTDTSGTQEYNLALSQRRADHVAGRLKSGGVPVEKIATYAFGETDPKVPTGDDVREAKNRRVEIVIE